MVLNTFKVFTKKNYRHLFLASFTSRMGSVIGMTAFMFYLLHRFSQQPFYATLTELTYSLPTLFVFFIIGVLSDRMDRQKIAANSEWLCGGLSILFLLTVWFKLLPLIFLILMVRSAVSKFFFPAEQSLIQGVLSDDEYTVAAGLNQMTDSLFMLFGTALGIFIYWVIGVEGAILVDILSYLVSGWLIRDCKIQRVVRLPNGSHRLKDLKFTMILKDFKTGFLYILKNPLLFSLIAGFFIFGIVNGALSVVPIFMLKYSLAKESYESWSVWLGIAVGGGILLGSILASLVSNKMKLRHMIELGLLMSGLFIALTGLSTHVIPYLIITFLFGLFLPLINIAIGGWLPKIVEPEMMGRVQGCITPLMTLSQSITLAIITVFFPIYIGPRGLLLLVGFLLIVVGIFYFFMLGRYGKEENSLKKESVKAAIEQA